MLKSLMLGDFERHWEVNSYSNSISHTNDKLPDTMIAANFVIRTRMHVNTLDPGKIKSLGAFSMHRENNKHL